MAPRICEVLSSAEAYWIGQGCAGAILPLVFSLVPSLRYTLSCLGIVFYGITSQVLSANNTVGGRILAGAMFLGSTLAGGLIGFAVVSLSWLARGNDVESLMDVAKRLNLDDLREYLFVERDFFRAVPLLYEDIELVLEENNERVSSTYWILVIVLFGVMSFPWAWVRVMGENNLKIGMATMGYSLMSAVATFALIMPVTGQYMFWTLVFGGFLKASLVAMLGTFLSGILIYVRSSHDELRKSLANVLQEAGKTLSHVNSCFHESMKGALETKARAFLSKEDLVTVLDYDSMMRKSGNVKDYLSILKYLQDANLYISSCKAEPPIPGFASQWGAKHELYLEVIHSMGDLLSQLGCLEVMYFSLRENILSDGQTSDDQCGGRLEPNYLHTHQNLESGMSMVSSLCGVCASVAGVLQECSDVLSRMPLFEKCSGNQLVWRPKPKGLWLEQYRRVVDILEKEESLKYLKISGILGIKDSLGSFQNGMMPFHFGGSSLVFSTAVESLLDYTIDLEQKVALALDITDFDRFDASDLHEMLRENRNGVGTTKPGKNTQMRPIPDASPNMSRIYRMRRSAILKAILLPFFIGSGLISILIYLSACTALVRISVTFFIQKCRGGSKEPETMQHTSLEIKRDTIFLAKYWSAIFLSMLGIILVGWLHIGNTVSGIYNAVELAKFLIKWQPMNVPIAVTICLTPTVNASIIKVLLRSGMIAFGGALGFATMLNGTLAQNAYFVFFIVMLVNGFFCSFSSMGTTARYSLFLVIYTYFSVVVCQYSGKCCKAGDVWEFAGRTLSTIIGASYALLFSWLVFPSYSSETIFSQEKALLASNMDTIKTAADDGPEILRGKQNPQEESRIDKLDASIPGDSEDVALVSLYRNVSESTSSSFQTRLALVKAILTEKGLNSLENWKFFFFNVTLISLPVACKLVFVRVSGMGIQINVYLHALKSSVFKSSQGLFQDLFFSKMMDQTRHLFDLTKELSLLIADNISQSTGENDLAQTRMLAILDLVSSIRLNLFETFASITDELESTPVSLGDLKCLSFYLYLLAALDQVHRLARDLCTDDRMRVRDNYMTFVFGLARKDELWKEFVE